MSSRSSPRGRKRPGVSLAELMLTMFLMMMVLAAVASLMHQYRDVTVFTQKKDASAQLGVALQQMRSELQSAFQIDSPTQSGGVASSLVLFRIDPSVARFPTVLDPTPAPIPGSWEPKDPGAILQVTYRLAGNDLVRELVPDSTPPGPQVVARDVTAFECERAAGSSQNLLMRASYREEKRIATYETSLYIRPGVTWAP